jgi:phage tail sheath protein FI
MVQLSYPGVYIVEKSSGVRTITGVATSIAAFFGRTLKGKINTPVRCFSYADFLRNFGGGHPKSELGASVKLFFDNGGTDCYIVRLTGAGAQAAGIDLHDLSGTAVLRATAKVPGEWGNGVRLEVSRNTPRPGESFTLTVIQEEGGREVAREVHANLVMDPNAARYAPTFVTQSSALISLDLIAGVDLNATPFDGFSEARRPLGTDLAGLQASLDAQISDSRTRFELSVNGSAFMPVDLTGWDVNDPALAALPDDAARIAELANQLKGRIDAVLATLVPAETVDVSFAAAAEAGGQMFLRLTASSGDRATVHVRRAATGDLSARLMMGVDNGGFELARRSNFRPAPTGSILRATDDSGDMARLNRLTGLTQADLTQITVASETAVRIDTPPNSIQTTTGADPFFTDNLGATSPNGNNDGVREKLRIIANAITAAAGTRYRAEVQGYEIAVLAKDGPFDERPLQIAFGGGVAPATLSAINDAWQLNTRQYTLGPNGTSSFVTYNPATQEGKNGGAPDQTAYFGDPIRKTGFYALDTVDLVNLIVLPADLEMEDPIRRQLWGPASIYAKARRAFLLMDAPDDWADAEGRPAIVQNTEDVNNLRASVVKDHAAVFYPKLMFNDGGLVRQVGPSGAIAGLMARIDGTRGVWKAAAGTEADLRNTVGLAVKLTDAENGVLNKLGVNCARAFPTGRVNWGARTMDGADDIGSEYKYIPIRRLALMIEESLYRGTQWVVFEPNDEPLWAKIRLNVGVFMNGLFRQGAFQGQSPQDAYFVKCDSETTTQADRNLGIVNIEVGFAPLKPAEFVVITIQQIAGDLT